MPAQWVKEYGKAVEEYAFGLAVDDSSNVFVTGLIGPGDTAFHLKGQCVDHDIFVARYNNQGNAQWLYKVGASLATDIGWGITLDKQHDIYTAASFQNSLLFGTDTISSKGFNDILLIKLNDQGAVLWARSAGGSLDDDAYSVVTDSHDQVYITGSFVGTVYFDTVAITSHGGGDAFLAKYDPSGNLLWVINAAGSTGEDAGYSLAVDPWDNIYLTGKFSGSAVFSSDTLVSKGSADMFIAKYDTLGTQQWVRSAGGVSVDQGQGIHTDANGSIYVTGYFCQTAFFESDTLISAGISDMFLARYDSQGSLLWSRSAGGSISDEGSAVTIAADKRIYVSGYFGDTATFVSQPLYAMGGYDAYLACFDSLGAVEWVKQGGGTGMDAAGAVGADTLGAVYLAGIFDYSCSFDTVTVSSVYDQNFFVAKFKEMQAVTLPEDLQSSDLVVFPNPAARYISLYMHEELSERKRVEIINGLGEIVLECEWPAGQQGLMVDLGSMPRGAYLVRLRNRDAILRTRIILH